MIKCRNFLTVVFAGIVSNLAYGVNLKDPPQMLYPGPGETGVNCQQVDIFVMDPRDANAKEKGIPGGMTAGIFYDSEDVENNQPFSLCDRYDTIPMNAPENTNVAFTCGVVTGASIEQLFIAAVHYYDEETLEFVSNVAYCAHDEEE